MTAVMDKPETLQESPATVEDFEVAKVNIDHPQVQHFIQAYFKRMGIEPTTHPLGINWLALVKESTIYCVVGIAGRGDKSLEITDLYCKPSHDGVRAGYLVLEFFKALVDAGRIPYIVGVVLWKNKAGQRHFKKAFGCDESSRVFIYPRPN